MTLYITSSCTDGGFFAQESDVLHFPSNYITAPKQVLQLQPFPSLSLSPSHVRSVSDFATHHPPRARAVSRSHVPLPLPRRPRFFTRLSRWAVHLSVDRLPAPPRGVVVGASEILMEIESRLKVAEPERVGRALGWAWRASFQHF